MKNLKFIILIIFSIIGLYTFSQQFINPSLDNPRNPYINSNLKTPDENIKLRDLYDLSPRSEQSSELLKTYIKGDVNTKGKKYRETLLTEIAGLLGITDLLSGPGEGKYAFTLYIKKIIDFFLKILAFIALIVLLIGFSKMFLHIGGDTEAIKNAKQYIKAATIAIILIGLSWFIVSFIFNIILR